MPQRGRANRLVIIMGIAAIGAGLFVAITLAAVSGRRVQNTPTTIVAGNEGQLRQAVAEKGALYFPDPKAGPGFWLTVENDGLVALVPDAPAPANCTVTYDTAKRYFRCEDRNVRIDAATLPRRPLSVDDKRRVRVDVRESKIEPAATSTSTSAR